MEREASRSPPRVPHCVRNYVAAGASKRTRAQRRRHRRRGVGRTKVALDPVPTPVLLPHPERTSTARSCRLPGLTPRVVHQTSSVEGVRALVARGFGWSMLLQQSRTNLSYEGRAYREPDVVDDVPDVALLAVTLHGRLTRRTAAFRDY